MISRVKNSGVTKTNVNVEISISYILFTWFGNTISNLYLVRICMLVTVKYMMSIYTARIQK